MKTYTNLILPDLHAPFHNRKLFTKICKLAKDIKPEHTVILGDWGDYYSVSRHHAGSLHMLKDINLGWEYEEQNKALDLLDSAIGRSRKTFLEGNHESSAIRWLQTGDNAKVAGAFAMPQEALRMRERGYDYKQDWRTAHVTIGKHLDIIHGEYCTTHSAKKHLDEWEGSVMMGHTHRFQTHVTGKRGSYNIGWLGDVTHPAFNYATASQKRKWVNGFAVVTTLDDGSFIPHPIQCWNNSFCFAGRLY